MSRFRSDGSIRWFGAVQEKRRQEAAAAAAKPSSKAGDSGGKEKGKGKGKGSPKGKGKSSKAKGDDGDGTNEAFESPFEGLWVVPGGRAAASVDTVSLPAHSILVAAAEDGRVYLWDMPRRRSGELSFGRSSSTPLYVIQVPCWLQNNASYNCSKTYFSIPGFQQRWSAVYRLDCAPSALPAAVFVECSDGCGLGAGFKGKPGVCHRRC
jgi:hypothetical protein